MTKRKIIRRSKYTPEQRAARLQEQRRKKYAEVKLDISHTDAMDEGEDPYPFTQAGSDRSTFNLGEGSRWVGHGKPRTNS